jgi:hypothetical protein
MGVRSGMDVLVVLGSSAAVSAVISAMATLITQHRLAHSRAEIDYNGS